MEKSGIVKTKEDINEVDNDIIIGRLSADTIKYFERVEQVLEDNVFEDEDHKEAFLHNVFIQIETDGTHLARHSNKTSRIIEKIIPCLNDAFYEKMIQLIQTEIEMLSCDRFGSHVIETLCKNSILHLENSVAETFVSFCKKLRKNCGVLLRDTYGCHVLSTVLQVLSGVKVPEIITKSRASRQSKIKKHKGSPDDATTEPVVTEVPRIFKKCFKKYVKVIQDDINFGELLCHRTASPVLQVLLIATSNVSETNYDILYSAIVSRGRIFQIESGRSAEEDEAFVCRLPVVFTDEVGSHLFEAVIKTAGEVYLEELGEKCFKICILSLCVHPLANYLAQTFLRCVKSAKHAEFFISRLIQYTEDILATGNMGCIVRLAELIKKFEIVEYQKKFIMALSTALHIPENCKEKPLSKLALCMMTYELLYDTHEKENIIEEKISDIENKESDGESKEINSKQMIQKTNINYHGCCLLQNLFSFKKSKLVVESFVELTIDEMKIIACHPNGSFTFESFFNSQWIPLKSKIYVGELLLDCTPEMACDKWGSRVIDCIFKGVDDAMQERLRYILREHKIKLESDLYGRIVLYNCGVKQHVVTMREVREQQQEKRKKLFENIIAENTVEKQIPPVTKKKKIDDRAEKYRQQLLSLGISFDNNTDNVKDDGEKTKEEVVDESKNDIEDNLSDVIQAIEASVKHKPKKMKLI